MAYLGLVTCGVRNPDQCEKELNLVLVVADRRMQNPRLLTNLEQLIAFCMIILSWPSSDPIQGIFSAWFKSRSNSLHCRARTCDDQTNSIRHCIIDCRRLLQISIGSGNIRTSLWARSRGIKWFLRLRLAIFYIYRKVHGPTLRVNPSWMGHSGSHQLT